MFGSATNSSYASGTYTTGVFGEAPVNSNSAGVYSNGKCASTAGFVNASDSRLKQNIKNVVSGLDVILKLEPKGYSFRQDLGVNFPSGTQMGFLAQDVEKVLPNLVSKLFLPNPESKLPNEEYLSMDYIGIIPYLVKSIQEQEQKIATLMSLVETLSALGNRTSNLRLQDDNSIEEIASISQIPRPDHSKLF